MTYAVLTKAGLDKLREASETHLRGVNDRFESRFSEDELQLLGELLGRLPLAGEEESCSV